MTTKDLDKKFEQLSPLLEMLYVIIKNTRKYLQIYAEDIDAAELREYQEVNGELEKLAKKLEVIFGLVPVNAQQPSAPENNVKKTVTVTKEVNATKPEEAQKPQEEMVTNQPTESVTEQRPAEPKKEMKEVFNALDQLKEELDKKAESEQSAPAPTVTPEAPAPAPQPVNTVDSAEPNIPVEQSAPVTPNVQQPVNNQMPVENNTNEQPQVAEQSVDVVTNNQPTPITETNAPEQQTPAQQPETPEPSGNVDDDAEVQEILNQIRSLQQ